LKKTLQIGITGGIGSGKSIVCRIFSVLGVPVYDADSRAKSIMTTDGILVSLITKEFGALSYYDDGRLNREHLAEAFKDSKKLTVLNNLIHPRVAHDYVQWVQEQKSPYVLKEAALLYEAKSNLSLDKIIVVYAPEVVRTKRVLQRDSQRNTKQVEEIMRNQMADDEKMKLADYVIYNDDSRLVTTQVLELHAKFLAMTS
jgi:dephospho-CoA kinase